MSGAQSPRRWSSWRRLGALLGPGRGRATWAGSAAASSGVQPSQCRAQQAAARAVAARHSRACASVRGHLPWWALGRVACRLGSVRDGNSHDKLAQQDGSVDQLAAPALHARQRHVPSGNRPFSPLSVFLPRNQPSPKSSSRSISSMRSPRLRLSSSGLRARNSSAVACQQCTCRAAPPSSTVLVARNASWRARRRGGDSRTTTSTSPGRQCSVCERMPAAMAMVACAEG